jgi:hypothetical protein
MASTTAATLDDSLRAVIRSARADGLLAAADGWHETVQDRSDCSWHGFERDGHVGSVLIARAKLHVSAAMESAPAILAAILPILAVHKVPFKFTATLPDLSNQLNGKCGLSQIGKFLTAYPSSDDDAISLARALESATQGLRGPYVDQEPSLGPGSLVHCRVGPTSEAWLQLATGRIVAAVATADGKLEPDIRSRYNPANLSARLAAAFHFKPWEIFERRVWADRFLVINTLAISPKGRSWLSIDLASDRKDLVVVKTARPCVLPDRAGRDAVSRQLVEIEALGTLRGEDFAPVLRDSGQVGEISWLAYDHIPGLSLHQVIHDLSGRGMTLDSALASSLLDSLTQILNRLHEKFIYFGDMKPENILVGPDWHLSLVDFETAQLPGRRAPQAFGTPGYVSRQRFSGDISLSVEDDFYGAATTVLSAVTGIDLAALGARTSPIPILKAVGGLDDSLRGRLFDLLKLGAPRSQNARVPDFTEEDNSDWPRKELDAVRESLASSAVIQGTKTHWLSNHPVAPGVACRDLYVGTSGVALFLALCARHLRSDRDLALAEGAARWLAGDAAPEPQIDMPGLFYGECGVGLLNLTLWELNGENLYLERATSIAQRVMKLSPRGPDIMTGAAGVGTYLLEVYRATGDRTFLQWAHRQADYLDDSKSKNEATWRLPEEMEGLSRKRYLGFAHGSAGIGKFLSELSMATDGSAAISLVDKIAELLDETQEPALVDGSGAVWPDERDSSERSIYWCHGTAGIGKFYLSAYEATQNAEYLDMARRCAETVAAGSKWIGPTFCHGISGNGSFLLDMAPYRANSRSRGSAIAFAANLARYRSPHSNPHRYSSERGDIFTPDLMIGESGVGLFLLRLVVQDEGERMKGGVF